MLIRVVDLETVLAPTTTGAAVSYRFPDAGTVRRVWWGTLDGLAASRAGLGLEVFRTIERRNVVNDGEAAQFATALAELGADPNQGQWRDFLFRVEPGETWVFTLDNRGSGNVTPRLLLDFEPDGP